MQKGIVTKSTGSWYQILPENSDEEIRCRIVGKFRLNGWKLTNPVAVGDYVSFEMDEDNDSGMIRDILPRKNYVVRQSPRKKHHLHLLASNVDQAFLIMTISNPKLKQGFIDRFLLMTEPHNIPVCIIFNKSDLYSEADLAVYELLDSIYREIGYETILVSSTEKTGIERVKELLINKITLISGQSGVGKSTLINAVQPDLDVRTGELSDYTGKGQHTTTFATMHSLDLGAKIIDTPGIKSLSFNNLEPMDVAHNFRELFTYSKDCKFSDCSHRNEPKCAVKDAVEEGTISELRYFNYIQILEDIEDQNYWERHTEM